MLYSMSACRRQTLIAKSAYENTELFCGMGLVEREGGGVDIPVNQRQLLTATATGTSPNKRFDEQNNSCARAF